MWSGVFIAVPIDASFCPQEQKPGPSCDVQFVKKTLLLCCPFELRAKVEFISSSVYNVGVLQAGVYVPIVDNGDLINTISRI